MRTKDVARIPQAHGASGPSASRAAGALLRRIGGDPLDDEMVDRCLRIEPQHFVYAGVDDVRNAFDRQRRFGDVRGQDHLAPIRRRQRALLRVDVEGAVQRQDERIDIGQLGARSLDLAHAGQKTEDVAFRIAQLLADRGRHRNARFVLNVDRKPARADVEDSRAAEELRDVVRGDGGGHHHHREIVARIHGLLRQRQRHIRMNAPLVKFIEDDDVEIAEQRIALQARGQDSFRGHEQTRAIGEFPFEADLPADFVADRQAALGRDPARQRTGGNAPRCSRIVRPMAANAGGMRVVFPDPAGATITALRCART